MPLGKVSPYRAALFFEANYDSLTAKERKLAETLADAAGRPVTRTCLIENLWHLDDEPEDPNKIIQILVHRMRKKMSGTNVKIETVWGIGYRLVIDNERI